LIARPKRTVELASNPFASVLFAPNGQGSESHPQSALILGMFAAHLKVRDRTKSANRSGQFIVPTAR
jgi:hypothetical protein